MAHRRARVRAVNRKLFRKLRLYAVVFLAVGALIVAANVHHLDIDSEFLATVCLAVGVYYAALSWFLIWRTARALEGPGGNVIVSEFADEGLRTLSKDGRVAHNWAVIASAEERGAFLILRSGKQPVVVVDRDCAGESAYAELRAFVAGRGLLS